LKSQLDHEQETSQMLSDQVQDFQRTIKELQDSLSYAYARHDAQNADKTLQLLPLVTSAQHMKQTALVLATELTGVKKQLVKLHQRTKKEKAEDSSQIHKLTQALYSSESSSDAQNVLIQGLQDDLTDKHAELTALRTDLAAAQKARDEAMAEGAAKVASLQAALDADHKDLVAMEASKSDELAALRTDLAAAQKARDEAIVHDALNCSEQRASTVQLERKIVEQESFIVSLGEQCATLHEGNAHLKEALENCIQSLELEVAAARSTQEEMTATHACEMRVIRAELDTYRQEQVGQKDFGIECQRAGLTKPHDHANPNRGSAEPQALSQPATDRGMLQRSADLGNPLISKVPQLESTSTTFMRTSLGKRAVSVRAGELSTTVTASVWHIDGLYEAVQSDLPGAPVYERVDGTNFTRHTDNYFCRLYFDQPSGCWCFDHNGRVAMTAADTALLPESIGVRWTSRYGPLDIDIIEVEIAPSLTEMKLSHCKALYTSLVRQQHETVQKMQKQLRTLNNNERLTEEHRVRLDAAYEQLAVKDAQLEGLLAQKERLCNEVKRLTTMLKDDSDARGALVQEIKVRDQAIRELRLNAPRCVHGLAP